METGWVRGVFFAPEPVVERLRAYFRQIIQLVIQAWKSAWAVSMGHLIRKGSQPLEISRQRSFSRWLPPGFGVVLLLIQGWKFAWAFSMGHLRRKGSQPLEISRWRSFSRWPPPGLERLSDIIVPLVIQGWKLAWAVSVGHLTRKGSQPLEISRWWPFSRWPSPGWLARAAVSPLHGQNR